MKDIYVISAYGALIEKCIDSKLAHLRKGVHTQHCWRFEAVLPSLMDVKQHTKLILLIKLSSSSENLSLSVMVQLVNTLDWNL